MPISEVVTSADLAQRGKHNGRTTYETLHARSPASTSDRRGADSILGGRSISMENFVRIQEWKSIYALRFRLVLCRLPGPGLRGVGILSKVCGVVLPSVFYEDTIPSPNWVPLVRTTLSVPGVFSREVSGRFTGSMGGTDRRTALTGPASTYPCIELDMSYRGNIRGALDVFSVGSFLFAIVGPPQTLGELQVSLASRSRRRSSVVFGAAAKPTRLFAAIRHGRYSGVPQRTHLPSVSSPFQFPAALPGLPEYVEDGIRRMTSIT